MNDVPIGALFGALIVLLFISAFFSASETGMMAVNRYRLKHQADSGHRAAGIVERLLRHPDRLLGTILLGNNLANIAAASVTTMIALRLYGEAAVSVGAILLTIVVLIFAEVAPKTIAALQPERVAFPTAYVLKPLSVVVRPVVWLVNAAANNLLRLLGFPLRAGSGDLSSDELRTVVREAGGLIPDSHREMLLRILELESITVDDIMISRQSIEAIDFEDDWDDIVEKLATSHHTRLPVYRGSMENVVGMLHVRQVLHLSQTRDFNRDTLLEVVQQPYYVPSGTRAAQLLLELRGGRHQVGLVIDEYGDVLGLVTIEEVLEEIVGEFTRHVPGISDDVHIEDDGSYLVTGNAQLRDLNRRLEWNLPTEGARTLNGLILETLEDIPQPGTTLRLGDYVVEIVQTRGPAVIVARIRIDALPEPSPRR